MKKIILVVLLTFVFLSNNVFSREFDRGTPVQNTPYEKDLKNLRIVLNGLNSDAKWKEVTDCTKKVFTYIKYKDRNTDMPSPPSLTWARKNGDCKDKSLLLAKLLNDKNIIIVGGICWVNDRDGHMWLEWKHEGEWYILDPTNSSKPIKLSSVGQYDYIPYYSWSKSGIYKHKVKKQ
ncbi:MAG: transglutaminase domain-containing protein [Candidatus Paceibacterota bacterium]